MRSITRRLCVGRGLGNAGVAVYFVEDGTAPAEHVVRRSPNYFVNQWRLFGRRDDAGDAMQVPSRLGRGFVSGRIPGAWGGSTDVPALKGARGIRHRTPVAWIETATSQWKTLLALCREISIWASEGDGSREAGRGRSVKRRQPVIEQTRTKRSAAGSPRQTCFSKLNFGNRKTNRGESQVPCTYG